MDDEEVRAGRVILRALRRFYYQVVELADTLDIEDSAAIAIQRAYRSYRARVFLKPRLHRQWAKLKILAFIGAHLKVKKKLLEESIISRKRVAAVKIQCQVRRRIATKFVAKRRIVKHRVDLQKRYETHDSTFQYYFEQVGAVITIQRWVRSQAGRRKKLWKAKNAKYILTLKRDKILFPVRKDLHAQEGIVDVVQANASRINSQVRGYLTRKLLYHVLPETVKRRKIQERLRQAQKYQHPIVKIQAFYRGYTVRSNPVYSGVGLRSRVLIRKRSRAKQRAFDLLQHIENYPEDFDNHRRNAVCFSNLKIGDTERFRKLHRRATKIQSVYRKYLARLKFIRLHEDYKEFLLIKIQRWMRRTLKGRLYMAMYDVVVAAMEEKSQKIRCLKKIQKAVRRIQGNVKILELLNARFVGTRKIQRAIRCVLFNRRLRRRIAVRRFREEVVVAGDQFCRKTLLYLRLEYLWAGIKEGIKTPAAQPEFLQFYLTQVSSNRMIEVSKVRSMAKQCKGILGHNLTQSIIETQFNKVKSQYEKKLDYGRFVDLVGILAAIKFLDIDPVALPGPLKETDSKSVLDKRTKAFVEDDESDDLSGHSSKSKERSDKDTNDKVLVAEKIREFSIGRLRGKAALITKFVLDYFVKMNDYKELMTQLGPQNTEEKSLRYMVQAAMLIQDFSRRRLFRRRLAKNFEFKKIVRRKQKLMRCATAIERIIRGHLDRQRAARLAQKIYIKYLDYETGLPYWYNQTTRTSFWTKPPLLLKFDVGDPIKIPSTEEQYIVTCTNCTDETATLVCGECEEAYCDACYASMHSGIMRKNHSKLKVSSCLECGFQIGTRRCHQCKENYCDTCFTQVHSKGRYQLHIFDWNCSSCESCNERAAQLDVVDPASNWEYKQCLVCHDAAYGPWQQNINAAQIKFLGHSYTQWKEKRTIEIKKEFKKQEIARGLYAKREKEEADAVQLIQRVWRGTRIRRKLFPFLAKQGELLRLRERDNYIRKSYMYKFLKYFALAPKLKSDTYIEQVRNSYPTYMQSIIAECVRNDMNFASRLMQQHQIKRAIITAKEYGAKVGVTGDDKDAVDESGDPEAPNGTPANAKVDGVADQLQKEEQPDIIHDDDDALGPLSSVGGSRLDLRGISKANLSRGNLSKGNLSSRDMSARSARSARDISRETSRDGRKQSRDTSPRKISREASAGSAASSKASLSKNTTPREGLSASQSPLPSARQIAREVSRDSRTSHKSARSVKSMKSMRSEGQRSQRSGSRYSEGDLPTGRVQEAGKPAFQIPKFGISGAVKHASTRFAVGVKSGALSTGR